MRRATFSMFAQIVQLLGRRDDRVILLKTSVEELENPRQEDSAVKDQSEETDYMMELLGVRPLLTLDSFGRVSKHLGVKLPYRAMP